MTTRASVQVTSQESSVRLLPWWPCCILRHHHANTMTARMASASNRWAPMITSANVHQAIRVCTGCSSEHHKALIILVLSRGLQKYVKYYHYHHCILITFTVVPCILILSKFYHQLMHKRIALTL